MIFDDIIVSAVNKSLEMNIPFALYIFPGDNTPVFFANPSYPQSDSLGARRFIIAPWLAPYRSARVIADKCDAAALMAMHIDNPLRAADVPDVATTDKAAYLEGVGSVVRRLGRDGGKTVISSVIRLDYEAVDVVSAASGYFSIHPEAFCYLYFTPDTGLWLGASPEIIYSFDKRRGKFKTMAFAGTRPVEMRDRPWDVKNIDEQRIVADYIADRLSACSVKFVEKPVITVDYGNIQHLCTFFEGEADASMTETIVDSLNPTPALAGYPTATAIDEIARVESYGRDCYGGVVGVDDSGATRVYVNLRCARLSAWSAILYVGGGITAASVPEDEWTETRLKSKLLKSVIEKSAKR